MKKYLAAVALAAALAQPAAAITFPKLTTIYVGTGVLNTGQVDPLGTATVFFCTNVSGVAAQVRFQVLSPSGSVAVSATFNINHGGTITASTHATNAYAQQVLEMPTVAQGAVNIESTQSAVFCSAVTIDAAADTPVGVPIRLVRINSHPGAEE